MFLTLPQETLHTHTYGGGSIKISEKGSKEERKKKKEGKKEGRKKKKIRKKAEEMAQWLRTFAAQPEDLGLFSSTVLGSS